MDIQLLRIEDYDEVWKIWIHTKGMGLNNRDDSREGIRKFLKKILLLAMWRGRRERFSE